HRESRADEIHELESITFLDREVHLFRKKDQEGVPEILVVAEFARIQTTCKYLNSGEFSYAETCEKIFGAHQKTALAGQNDGRIADRRFRDPPGAHRSHQRSPRL